MPAYLLSFFSVSFRHAIDDSATEFEKATVIVGVPVATVLFFFAAFHGSLKLTENRRASTSHEYGDERTPVDPLSQPPLVPFTAVLSAVVVERRARVSFERSHAPAATRPSRVTFARTRHAKAFRRRLDSCSDRQRTQSCSGTGKVSRGKCSIGRAARCHECVTLSRMEPACVWPLVSRFWTR